MLRNTCWEGKGVDISLWFMDCRWRFCQRSSFGDFLALDVLVDVFFFLRLLQNL